MEYKRRSDKSLIFDDYPQFQPNLTPKQIARRSAIKLGVISVITSLIVLFAAEAIQFWYCTIALGVLIEEISYFVIYHAVEDFINQRIRWSSNSKANYKNNPLFFSFLMISFIENLLIDSNIL